MQALTWDERKLAETLTSDEEANDQECAYLRAFLMIADNDTQDRVFFLADQLNHERGVWHRDLTLR